jgi:hypothetical protein
MEQHRLRLDRELPKSTYMSRVNEGSAQADASKSIESFLRDNGFSYERVHDNLFVTEIPGEQKLKTNISLLLGRHSLSINAFVMRAPDENRAEVHEYLLEHNRKLFGISYALDQYGDIYVTGRLPLAAVSPESLDQIFGSISLACDANFNALVAMGFAESIKREWAWRVSRGEPLTNLKAFSDLIGTDA